MRAIIYRLPTMCRARCFIYFIASTPQTALQGRHYLCNFTELETDSDLQFASSHPAVQTEDYLILQVHALLAPPPGLCVFYH